MSRRAAGALGGVFALALLQVPALAAEQGRIEGRVVDGATGDPVPGVEVVLTAISDEGVELLARSITTGPAGRYSFRDLKTGTDRFYALDAHYQEGLFPGSPITLPDDTDEEPAFETTLRVWDTTRDPDVIIIRRNDIFVTGGAGAATVIESVTVTNLSEGAYIGRGGGEGDGPSPSLGFALPSEATGGVAIIDGSLDVPVTLEQDFGFAITTAVPPGESRITFTYQVRGAAGVYDLSRTVPYDVVQATVHAEPPLRLEGNRMSEDGEVTIGDVDYRRYSTSASVAAGDALQMQAVAEAGAAPGLVAGAVAAGLGGLGLLFYAVRRRGASVVVERDDAPDATTRGEILTAIARLDLRRAAGEVPEEDWRRLRAELKQRLGEVEGGQRVK